MPKMTDEYHYPPEAVMARAADIKLIWESDPIQTTYKRRNEFQIVECARYFLSKVTEIMQPDYVPTDDDLLQTRQQTIGIVEHKFDIKERKNGGKTRTLVMVSHISKQNYHTRTMKGFCICKSLQF